MTCDETTGTERATRRGDTFVLDVQVKRVLTAGCDAVPVDITGWMMWFTAKFYFEDYDSQAVTQRTSAPLGGIVFTEPSIGKAQITVPSSATLGFPDAEVKLVYDVQVKDLVGNIFTVEVGEWLVRPDVTRTIV